MKSLTVGTTDPIAIEVVAAIHGGDVAALERLLDEHPGLACARLGDDEPDGMSRSLLHVATDWPGHFPAVADSIRALARAGADVNSRFRGPHEETPLHWAASSDDVVALDALIDCGARVGAAGAVIAGGPPLEDARAFGNWAAARRLVERGAEVGLRDAAALGLVDRLEALLDASDAGGDVLDAALWSASHGGRRSTAEILLTRGADLNWIAPWERATPLDAAARGGNHDFLTWLHSRGALTAAEVSGA